MPDLTLARLDDFLDRRGLRPLPSLGDLSEGEPQLIEIAATYDHNVFTDIVFRQALPSGSWQNYVIRFNQNSSEGNGAVFAIRVNRRYFVFVEQFRPAIGRRSLEAARGFRECSDGSNEEVMYRELVEEVLGNELGTCTIVATHLGDIFEFTGTHNVVSSHYLVEVTIPEERVQFLRGTESGIMLVFMDRSELDRERSGFGRLRDNFTLTVVGLALAHLDRRAGFWPSLLRLLTSALGRN